MGEMEPFSHKPKIPPRILVVAGSDPIAGAGLQADLKTITALGGYAMTAVTAITVQDSGHVRKILPLAPELVVEQMKVCLEDVGADAIKLGMLGNATILEAILELLLAYPTIPVVADPVLSATAGGTLLPESALESYRHRLLPRLALLTPNLREAALLSDLPVTNPDEMAAAAQRLGEKGAAILVTGGHLPGEEIIDLLWERDHLTSFRGERLAGGACHGTGCTLASAITYGLAYGAPLAEAVALGIAHVRRGIIHALALGHGQRLLWQPPEPSSPR